MKPPSQFVAPAMQPPCSRTYWVIDHAFLAGAFPGKAEPAEHQKRIESLYGAGIRTFINLQEEGEANKSGKKFARYDDAFRQLAAGKGHCISHLRFPIRDGGITTNDGMRSILDAIDLSLAADRPVYVHCYGGIGRTGTTVCCWLLRHGLASADNVLDLLKHLRQADKERANWPAPENSKQADFVTDWRD